MGQGSINQATPTKSPMEGILQALQAVHQFYGINTESQQQKLNDLKIKQEEAASDAGSDYSKNRQLQTSALYNTFAKKGYLTPDQVGPMMESIGKQSGASLDKDTETNPLLKLATAQMQADAMGNKFMPLVQNRKEMQENTIHEGVINRLASDPKLGQWLGQTSNLQNAVSNMMNADKMTPAQFDETQQAIRANLGLKGTSGIGERERTQLNSLGLNADRFAQFLTGRPANIDQNNEFVKHIKNLASLEMNNITAQTNKRIDALSSGNSWLYNNRKDLKADLDNRIDKIRMQYQSSAPSQTDGALEQPGGMNTKPNQSFSPEPAPADPFKLAKMEQERRLKLKTTTASTGATNGPKSVIR